jgi:nucleoside-diphosphate-sugar epimerase
MDVAIIGGTRHVGPGILTLLTDAGYRVGVFSRGRSQIRLPAGAKHITVDRKVPGQLDRSLINHRPDVVIDMIGFVVADIQEVLSALPSLQHYIFCSSTAVYGRIEDSTPSETSTVDVNDLYAQDKADCDQYLLDQYRNGGVPFTSLRLSHPYGPRDHLLYTTGRESLFLDRMRKRRPIIIPGCGMTRIHPIFVTDAARAFVHVLGQPRCMGHVYNLAGDQILTLDEYFESISRVLGVPLLARKLGQDFFHDRAGLWANWKRKFDFGYNWVGYQSAFDVAALRQTGFQCLTDHDTGVALTMQWLDSNNLVEVSSDEDEEDRLLAQA